MLKNTNLLSNIERSTDDSQGDVNNHAENNANQEGGVNAGPSLENYTYALEQIIRAADSDNSVKNKNPKNKNHKNLFSELGNRLLDIFKNKKSEDDVTPASNPTTSSKKSSLDSQHTSDEANSESSVVECGTDDEYNMFKDSKDCLTLIDCIEDSEATGNDSLLQKQMVSMLLQSIELTRPSPLSAASALLVKGLGAACSALLELLLTIF